MSMKRASKNAKRIAKKKLSHSKIARMEADSATRTAINSGESITLAMGFGDDDEDEWYNPDFYKANGSDGHGEDCSCRCACCGVERSIENAIYDELEDQIEEDEEEGLVSEILITEIFLKAPYSLTLEEVLVNSLVAFTELWAGKSANKLAVEQIQYVQSSDFQLRTFFNNVNGGDGLDTYEYNHWVRLAETSDPEELVSAYHAFEESMDRQVITANPHCPEPLRALWVQQMQEYRTGS